MPKLVVDDFTNLCPDPSCTALPKSKWEKSSHSQWEKWEIQMGKMGNPNGKNVPISVPK
jgi:hypothetical protein